MTQETHLEVLTRASYESSYDIYQCLAPCLMGTLHPPLHVLIQGKQCFGTFLCPSKPAVWIHAIGQCVAVMTIQCKKCVLNATGVLRHRAPVEINKKVACKIQSLPDRVAPLSGCSTDIPAHAPEKRSNHKWATAQHTAYVRSARFRNRWTSMKLELCANSLNKLNTAIQSNPHFDYE